MRKAEDEKRAIEWQAIDEIKRDLEAPIESTMIAIFDEQLLEIESSLGEYRFMKPETLSDYFDDIEKRAKIFSVDSIFDFARWISETWNRLSSLFRGTFFGGYETGRNQINIDLPDLTSQDPAVRLLLDEMQANSRIITETTRDQLAELIDRALNEGWGVDQLRTEIQMQFEGINRARAHTIAVTNTTAGFSRGQKESFRRAGLGKQWLSQRDPPRVRRTHFIADGQVRHIDEPFEVGAARPQYPADPNIAATNPEEFFGCRCAMMPAKV